MIQRDSTLPSSAHVRKLARLRPHFVRALWAVAEQATGPMLQLVLTPLLLRWLGVEEFGLWALGLAVASMGQLASFGSGGATTKHVSADLGANRRTDAVAAVRAATTVTLGMGVMLLAVSVWAAVPLAARFFTGMGDAIYVGSVLFMAVLLLLVQELDGVYAAAIRGFQRFDLAARVEIVGRLCWTAAILALAWQYRSVVAILGGAIALTAGKLTVRAVIVNRLLEVRHAHWPSMDAAQLRRVTDFGRWQWVQSIGTVLFSVVDRLLVGWIFGASDLARYSVCLQVAQSVHLLPAAAMQILFPWLSARKAGAGTPSGRTLMVWSLVGGAICVLPPAVIALLANPLLSAWIDPDFAASSTRLLQIFLLAYGVLAFNIPGHYLLLGLGDARFVSLSNLAAGVLSITASVALLPLGLVAFAAGKLGYGPIIALNQLRLGRIGHG